MPDATARLIRIFLSSPNDVEDERKLALKVIDQLPYDPLLRGKIALEVVAWDKPGAGTPLLATMTPQEAINQGLPKPSECDIVIVIFWARMGTPLPEEYIKPEEYRFPTGTTWADWRYLSGTEWEYVDAMQGKVPYVVPYRRSEKKLLDLSAPDFDAQVEQQKHVNAFFDAFTNPDSSIRRGYNGYATPAEFQEQLETHLRELIRRIMEEPARKTVPVTTSPDASAPLWTGSPFPGLRAFTPDDAPIFFGRDREVDALLRRVNESRFVVVVGASGSGKSSLVGAGLIPRLLDNAIPGSKDWIIARVTPGYTDIHWKMRMVNPFDILAGTLTPYDVEKAATADVLLKDHKLLGTLVEAMLQGRPDWAELLLFIDQFEELFTIASPKYVVPFAELLAHARNLKNIRVVATLRADFYHRCVEYSQLVELFRDGSFPLSMPEIDDLLDMIKGPAEKAGLEFDEGLPGRILRDTGQEPGALALMAYTLDELYQACRSTDGALSHEAYEALGGVQGAIGTRAESVFADLDKDAQDVLPHIFRELVDVDERGTATRQRALLGRVTGHDPETRLVTALTDARLLVQTRDEENQPVVEVAHEALLRSWPRLADWIDWNRDDIQFRKTLKRDVQAWFQHKRSVDYLYHGTKAIRAEEWAVRNSPNTNSEECTFIELSRIYQEIRSTRQIDSNSIVSVAETISSSASEITDIVEDLRKLDDIADDVERELEGVVGIADEIQTEVGKLRLSQRPQLPLRIVNEIDYAEAANLDETVWDICKGSGTFLLPRLSLKLDCADIRVRMRRDALEYVITALLNNSFAAVSYQDDKVVVRTALQGHMAEVRVEDLGYGVNSEVIPYLFKEPIRWVAKRGEGFKEVHEGKTLLEVRFFLEQHGGRIWLDYPEAGQGSCFIFNIPIVEPYAVSV